MPNISLIDTIFVIYLSDQKVLLLFIFLTSWIVFVIFFGTTSGIYIFCIKQKVLEFNHYYGLVSKSWVLTSIMKYKSHKISYINGRRNQNWYENSIAFPKRESNMKSNSWYSPILASLMLINLSLH